MILYFSGTGNSQKVAQELAAQLQERLFCMEQAADEMPLMEEGEALGIVFPVYAWGVPRIVERFQESLRAGQHSGILCPHQRYVWTVMTCGDDMGFADRVLERCLGRAVNAAFSVQMPNTYVCLPGFDVDPREVAEQKVADTRHRLPEIARAITRREQTRQLHRGIMSRTKTYILRPLFNRFLVTDRYFHTTVDCSACGRCAKDCPVHAISLCDGHPEWLHNDACTGCLRCYHKCPKRAVEWGRFTQGKGVSLAEPLRNACSIR